MPVPTTISFPTRWRSCVWPPRVTTRPGRSTRRTNELWLDLREDLREDLGLNHQLRLDLREHLLRMHLRLNHQLRLDLREHLLRIHLRLNHLLRLDLREHLLRMDTCG